VEGPLLLQFSIALFTGMVLSTFIPPVRRSIPRPVEVLMWIGLATVCAVGVLGITDRNARELTASVVWGAEQLIDTMAGLLGAGVMGWISEHRFPIAMMVVLLAGVDLLALAIMRSRRTAERSRPRVRLGEWMELPRPGTEPAPVGLASATGNLSRRVTGVPAFAVVALLTFAVNVATWARDVVVPRGARRLVRAATTGSVRSRVGLETLRDAAAELRFASRAWYTAVGTPAVGGLAAGAAGAIRSAAAAGRAAGSRGGVAGRVIDIDALLSAQATGWSGPPITGPDGPTESEGDGAEQRPDRLAS
jgi:hypothetical protein